MNSVDRTFSVGLFADNDSNWIAGALYLSTLIRSLAQLPAAERPDLHLIAPRDMESSVLQTIEHPASRTHRYDYRANATIRSIVKTHCQAWVRNRERPMTFERLLETLNLDFLFPCQTSLGRNFSTPWIGWIPDFQHKRCPQFFQESELIERDRRFQRLLNDAAHVIVSSNDAREDLFRWYQADPHKVSTHHFCTHPEPAWFSGDPEATADSFGLPKKYLFFPSQFWIHKNHSKLLEALLELRDGGLNEIALVLTGKDRDYRHPEHATRIKAFIDTNNLEKNVFYLGLLPRVQQMQIMRRAVAIVQPSHFEGWSMLVEDCRALGKRIYLSDIPVHREQAPPDAVYFDPNAPEDLAQHLSRDWPQLKPGPDPAREEEARGSVEMISREYARNYLRIVSRAAGQG